VFPGLVYKCAVPNRVSVLCFASGKCIISGCKTRDQAADVWGPLYREHLACSLSHTRFSSSRLRDIDWQRVAVLLERRSGDMSTAECMRDMITASARVSDALRSASRVVCDQVCIVAPLESAKS